MYEAALKYAPDDKVITTALGTWRKESQITSRFYEARGAHFAVKFEGPADDAAAQRIVQILEQACTGDRASAVDISDESGERCPVHPTSSSRTRRVPPIGLPVSTTGASSCRLAARSRRPTSSGDSSCMSTSTPSSRALPGRRRPRGSTKGLPRHSRPAVLAWAERALAQDKRRIPLDRLERSFSGMSAEQAHVAYALSAVAVRKMLDLRGAQATVSLLKALGRGTPFPSAFQQAISMRYEEFVTIIGRE